MHSSLGYFKAFLFNQEKKSLIPFSGCGSQPSYKHAIPQQNGATCVQRLDDSQDLQFTLLIALCYVLHRCTNQEIRRW